MFVNREQLQTEFKINRFTKHYKVLHNQHIQQNSVNNAVSLSSISEDSILHDSKFSMSQKFFFFDAMHDLCKECVQAMVTDLESI